jgi:hypothetical protein
MDSGKSFGDVLGSIGFNTVKLVDTGVESTGKLLETGVNFVGETSNATGITMGAVANIAKKSSHGVGVGVGSAVEGVGNVSKKATETLGEGIGIVGNLFKATNTYVEGYNDKLKYEQDKNLTNLIKQDELTKEKWDVVFNSVKEFNPEQLITEIEGERIEIESDLKEVIDFILYERLLFKQTSIKHILGAGYVIECIRKILEMKETPTNKRNKIAELKKRVTDPDWWTEFQGWAGNEVRWGKACPEVPQAKLGGSKKSIKKKRRKTRKTRNKINKTKKSAIRKKKNKKTNRRKKSR